MRHGEKFISPESVGKGKDQVVQRVLFIDNRKRKIILLHEIPMAFRKADLTVQTQQIAVGKGTIREWSDKQDGSGGSFRQIQKNIFTSETVGKLKKALGFADCLKIFGKFFKHSFGLVAGSVDV